MAIPYNPSSFATNKTILQAIEELKNYLKDNPCYKIYYVNTAYVVGTTTYNLSDVDDTDGTMTAYDVVFFTNSYYAKVINVDTNTFDIEPAVSFKGATGNTGPAGADGSDGVSVTNVTVNSSNHLIVTLSDGNTIDAGAINCLTEVKASDVNSESATNREVLKADGNGGASWGTLTVLNLSPGTAPTGRVMQSGLYDSVIWAKVGVANMTSDSATAGQVLTADGSGNANWTTVSAGGYENTVTISTTSGTFSDSDFAKLGYGDSTIIYNTGYSELVYVPKYETGSTLVFYAIDQNSKNNLQTISIIKSTKAYSMSSFSMIKSATFDSETATAGKVLTANGSGGTSWETAGGGGSGKYYHKITYEMSIGNTGGFRVFFEIINTDSSAYTTSADVISALYSFTTSYKGATGVYHDGTHLSPIYAVKSNNTNITAFYTDMTTSARSVSLGTATNVNDVVVAL